MRATTFLIIFLVLSGVVGCSPDKHRNIYGDPPQPNAISKGHAEIFVPDQTTPVTTAEADPNWIPDFRVECAAESCPKQVGLLAFLNPPQNGFINYKRCAAFLIGPDQIMTNGHCDYSADRVGYFVTQKIGGQKIQRKIAELVYKSHTPGAIDPTTGKAGTSGEIDVAVFRLESEIPKDTIIPFTVAQGTGPELDKLYAYVINEVSEANHFKIELRVCDLIRHESIFPFVWSENPDVGWSFHCETQGGNSGSPMLASADSLVVEAIHVGSTTLEKQMKLTSQLTGRDPYIYDRHAVEHFSNLRCVAFPDRPAPACVRVSPAEISRRFDQYQQSKFTELDQRQFPGHEREQFRFTPYAYQQNSVAPDYEFEVFYVPNCRLSPQAPEHVPVKIEQLRLVFDEWARIEFESVQIRTATAKVLPQSHADIFVLETTWPAPSGQIRESAGKDLRQQWATTFNVAIPFCK